MSYQTGHLYVVLNLRKCTRGLPLLPTQAWRPALDESDTQASTDPTHWRPMANAKLAA